MCLCRYTPAEIVSGVPRIRQSEFIFVLLISFIVPVLLDLIVLFVFAKIRDLTLLSKSLLLFCAFIISLNFSYAFPDSKISLAFFL